MFTLVSQRFKGGFYWISIAIPLELTFSVTFMDERIDPVTDVKIDFTSFYTWKSGGFGKVGPNGGTVSSQNNDNR